MKSFSSQWAGIRDDAGPKFGNNLIYHFDDSQSFIIITVEKAHEADFSLTRAFSALTHRVIERDKSCRDSFPAAWCWLFIHEFAELLELRVVVARALSVAMLNKTAELSCSGLLAAGNTLVIFSRAYTGITEACCRSQQFTNCVVLSTSV